MFFSLEQTTPETTFYRIDNIDVQLLATFGPSKNHVLQTITCNQLQSQLPHRRRKSKRIPTNFI